MSRRHRPSVPMSPADDVSHLSLIEVRERLARNERVLNSGLFASAGPGGGVQSPVSGNYSPNQRSGGSSIGLPLPPAFSPSPTQTPESQSQSQSQAQSPIQRPNSFSPPIAQAQPIPGPSRNPMTSPPSAFGYTTNGNGAQYNATGTSPTDNVRSRLMQVRAALLAREQQLMLAQTTEGMGDLELDLDAGVNGLGDERRRSSASIYGVPPPRPGLQTSGKQAALERIREKDKSRPAGSVLLPINDSLHLAAREFDNETAAQLSSLAIAHTQSSSPKPRNRRAPHTPGPNGSSRYPDSPSARHAPSGSRSLGDDHTRMPLGGGDEIDRARYLARINSFMSHRNSDSEDSDEEDGGGDGRSRIPLASIGFDMEDEDEDSGQVERMFDLEDGDGGDGDVAIDYPGANSASMGEYDGRMQGAGGGADGGYRAYRKERGTGEEVDVFGEDDERFAEGNEDYELGGGGLREEGGRQVGGM